MLKEWLAQRKSYVSIGDGEGQELKREGSEERRLSCSSPWKKSIKAAWQWVCGRVGQSSREDSERRLGQMQEGLGNKDSRPPGRVMGRVIINFPLIVLKGEMA